MRHEVRLGRRLRPATAERHLEGARLGAHDRDRPRQQVAELRLETQLARVDPHRLVIDDQRVELQRSAEGAACSAGRDRDRGEGLEPPQHEMESGLGVDEPRGPHRQPRQHEEQQDAADCEHPSGHRSTCVMLRCSRGFLPGSDSAWATSSPIISIGSFQRMPTPTEYSSGSPHSLKALPVS